MDLRQQIINLPRDGTHLDERIQQTGGTDDLFHQLARTFPLISAGSGGDVDHLVQPLFKFFEFQRPVVIGAG